MTDRQIRRQKKAWRNRIVGTGEEAPDQLLANPGNWRIHPKAQQDALSGALDDIGWIQQVVVNQRTGHLVDGHLRVSLALRNNEPTVPVLYVDLDPREEALALATLDPISAMAATDKAKLDALLHDVDTGSAALQEMLSELAAKSGLEYGKPEAVNDPGAQLDRAEELRVKWNTERGQLWEIPSATVAGKCHRLLCGDSTSAEDVARLMGDAKAEMVWTDPPYGMDLDTDFAAMSERSTKVQGRKYDKVLGDNVVFDFAAVKCPNASEQFWWGADYYCGQLPSGGSWFVWDKRIGVIDDAIGNMFELCWSKRKHRREIIRMLWSGITAKEHGETRCHPTQKPVALAAWFIEKYSQPAAIVWDGFLGSGTTAVAAEQTGRVCYGMEIEPKYVAVALERLAGMGLEPRLT